MQAAQVNRSKRIRAITVFAASKRYATRGSIARRSIPAALQLAFASGTIVFLTTNDKARVETTCKGMRRRLLRPSEIGVLTIAPTFRLPAYRLATYKKLLRDSLSNVNVHADGEYTPLCYIGRLITRDTPSTAAKKMDLMEKLISRGASFGIADAPDRRCSRCDHAHLVRIPSLVVYSVASYIMHSRGMGDEFPYIAKGRDEAYLELLAGAWSYSSRFLSGNISRALVHIKRRPSKHYFLRNPMLDAIGFDNAKTFRHMHIAGFHRHQLRKPYTHGLLHAAIVKRSYNVVEYIMLKMPMELVRVDEFGYVPAESVDGLFPRGLRTRLLRRSVSAVATKIKTIVGNLDELFARREEAIRDGRFVRASMAGVRIAATDERHNKFSLAESRLRVLCARYDIGRVSVESE